MAAFTVIDHTEIGSGGASSWTESSISSSYDHLYLVMSLRKETSGSAPSTFDVVYNGDTTDANYSNTYLYATTNGTVQTGNTGGRDQAAWQPTSDYTADTFGTTTLWIPHYANTSNYKQIICQSVVPNNSSTDSQWGVRVTATLWQNTAAINSVNATAGGGNDFAQYSTFTLYGVTGA